MKVTYSNFEIIGAEKLDNSHEIRHAKVTKRTEYSFLLFKKVLIEEIGIFYAGYMYGWNFLDSATKCPEEISLLEVAYNAKKSLEKVLNEKELDRKED